VESKNRLPSTRTPRSMSQSNFARICEASKSSQFTGGRSGPFRTKRHGTSIHQGQSPCPIASPSFPRSALQLQRAKGSLSEARSCGARQKQRRPDSKKQEEAQGMEEVGVRSHCPSVCAPPRGSQGSAFCLAARRLAAAMPRPRVGAQADDLHTHTCMWASRCSFSLVLVDGGRSTEARRSNETDQATANC
jgi:hypothetical protein